MDLQGWLGITPLIMGAGSAILGIIFGSLSSPSRRTKNSFIIAFITLAVLGTGSEIGSRLVTAGQTSAAQLRKDALLDMANEGEAVMRRCAEEQFPQLAQEWANKANQLVESSLGKRYVPLFRSGVGLLPFSAPSACIGSKIIWENLNDRVRRLQEFSGAVILPLS